MVKRKAQEEMVGFAVIMIIVSVIIMVFIGIYFSKPKTDGVQSYEVESFLQALLQHTSDCEDGFEMLSVRSLIFRCKNPIGGMCADGVNFCEALNNTIVDVLNHFWRLQAGYVFEIKSPEEPHQEEIILIEEGTLIGGNYREAIQLFSRGGETISISFRAYS